MGKKGGGGVPGRDPAERFRSFVTVEDTPRPEMDSSCHRWTGAYNSKNYGCFSFGGKGKVVLAHRWAYEHLGGESIPEGMTIDHRCRFTLCVNPDHLRVMSGAENTLIGESPPSINARRTHCKSGHPLEGENLRIRKDNGRRQCRQCAKCAKERFRQRQASTAS